MTPRELAHGDVVQLDPALGMFGGCFMLVTEPKSWGAQGFVQVPGDLNKGGGAAYFRARWEHMEYIGKAIWAPKPDSDEAAPQEPPR